MSAPFSLGIGEVATLGDAGDDLLVRSIGVPNDLSGKGFRVENASGKLSCQPHACVRTAKGEDAASKTVGVFTVLLPKIAEATPKWEGDSKVVLLRFARRLAKDEGPALVHTHLQ